MIRDDRLYFRQRLETEYALAGGSHDAGQRAAHLELAALYAEQLRRLDAEAALPGGANDIEDESAPNNGLGNAFQPAVQVAVIETR